MSGLEALSVLPCPVNGHLFQITSPAQALKGKLCKDFLAAKEFTLLNRGCLLSCADHTDTAEHTIVVINPVLDQKFKINGCLTVVLLRVGCFVQPS